jgi:hypothetical protein
LGPPLLSASWSPPLFCGIPEDDEPELDWLDCAGALLAGGEDEVLDEPELPPQPAIAKAASARPTTASRRRADGDGRRMGNGAPLGRRTARGGGAEVVVN